MYMYVSCMHWPCKFSGQWEMPSGSCPTPAAQSVQLQSKHETHYSPNPDSTRVGSLVNGANPPTFYRWVGIYTGGLESGLDLNLD